MPKPCEVQVGPPYVGQRPDGSHTARIPRSCNRPDCPFSGSSFANGETTGIMPTRDSTEARRIADRVAGETAERIQEQCEQQG